MLAALVCLAGCARKPVTASELSSELTSIESNASESELFIQELRAGKMTGPFARAHTTYLAVEIADARQKLDSAPAGSGLEQKLAETRDQVRLLSDQVTRLSSSLNQPRQLDEIEQNIKRIHDRLKKMRAAL